MKKLILLIMLFNIQAYSQNNDYIKNVQSIDGTIETLYSVISGDKEVKRDWDLFKYLFHKDAKLILSQDFSDAFVLMFDIEPESCPKCGSTNIETHTKSKRSVFLVWIIAGFTLFFYEHGFRCIECDNFWKLE